MICTLRRFIDDSRGVAALEYALLVGLITLGIYAAMSTGELKSNLGSIFKSLSDDIKAAATP
ncbi:MAG: Flp family type IVb pilin [Telmatospirillum sp.]|nr:Flp family type IVb pilin [Telmatospirillum sp.]